MRILAIETSCDDTGVALVEASGTLRVVHGELVEPPKFKVLQNLVSSQIKIHRPFGGVVPTLAKREHIRNLPILFKKIMADFSKSKIKNQNVKLQFKDKKTPCDVIAVTVGPGLEPALWTGINFAVQLRSRINADRNADKRRKNIRVDQRKHPQQSAPMLVGVNHMEGHLYSFLLQQKTVNSKIKSQKSKLAFPAVALIVSGGHTILLLLQDLTHWKKLGETRDDAAGEAFDKVARLLGLPYPGGPEIQKIAAKGNGDAISFPRPMMNAKNYDFSFSGLKTAVLYYLREHGGIVNNELRINATETKSIIHNSKFAIQNASDVAASFEQAATDVLVHKTFRAAEEYRAQSVILCGGVAANLLLRKKFAVRAKEMGVRSFVPAMEYNNDNAAMIAAAGYLAHLRGKKLKMEAQGNLSI